MKLIKHSFLISGLILLATLSQAESGQSPQRPPLVRDVTDTFCCNSKQKTVGLPVDLFGKPDPAAFLRKLRIGEKAVFIKEQLIVQPILARVVYPIKRTEYRNYELPVGATFYALQYVGEGFSEIEYEGKGLQEYLTPEGGMGLLNHPCSPPSRSCWYETLEDPGPDGLNFHHWIQIRLQNGQLAWVRGYFGFSDVGCCDEPWGEPCDGCADTSCPERPKK